MSRLHPLIYILAAVLCFIAGYTVGKKNGSFTIPEPISEFQVETATQEDALLAPEPEESIAVDAASKAADSAPLDDAPDLALLAQRAQQRFIILTDKKERSIEVEIQDISENHLKVRRRSDLRMLQIPVEMLSTQDQTFANYLWKEKNPAPAERTDEQMILEELFGGF